MWRSPSQRRGSRGIATGSRRPASPAPRGHREAADQLRLLRALTTETGNNGSLDGDPLDEVGPDVLAGRDQPGGLRVVVVGIRAPVVDRSLDGDGVDGEPALGVEVQAQEVLVAGDAGRGEGLVAVGA